MSLVPSRSPRLLIVAFVLMGTACLVFLQHVTGVLFYKAVSIPSRIIIQAESGFAFTASSRVLIREMQSLHNHAAVTEDGVKLPLRVPVSEDVRTEGHGRYSFSRKNVWFSTVDGSDPRTNGRVYAGLFPTRVPPVLIAGAWLTLAAGFVLSVRALTGAWVWSWWRREVRTPATEKLRDWSLDVLRGLAVLLVLIRHGILFPEDVSRVLHDVNGVVQTGGWIGVDLFFVLSGYLVSGLLFSEYRRAQRLRIGRFLWRRGMKIYPAYLALIIVTLIGASFGFANQVTLDTVIAQLLFLQNYIGLFWAHTWTLAVEEHFYLILAFMFALAVENGRDQTKRFFSFVPKVFFAFAIGCLIIRCLRHLYYGPVASAHFALTHVRLDALMCGVWLRHWQEIHPEAFRKLAVNATVRWALLALLLFAPCFLFGQFTNSWITSVGFATNYLAAACLLMSSRGWEARWPGLDQWCRPLAAVGRHSYSIYLWHAVVESWIARPLYESMIVSSSLATWLMFAVVYYGGSIFFGILLGKAIEQPALHLRDRLFPSPDSGAPPPATVAPVPNDAPATTAVA